MLTAGLGPKRLNVGLLIGVSVAALLLVVGVHLLHQVQTRRIARVYLQQADAAAEAGNPEEEAQFLARYLQLAPDDVDTLARYGLTLNQLPAPAARLRAQAVFKQVLRQQPRRQDIRSQLAWLAVEQGRFAEARPHLLILLRDAPGDARIEAALARCAELDRDYAHAIEYLDMAVRHDPTRIDEYVRLARLLRQDPDSEERADEVMDRMVIANPDSFRAWLARGRYRQEFGSPDDAVLDLTRARKLAPEDGEVLLASADSARAQGHYREARAYLELCLRKHPTQASAYRLLGEVEAQAGRPAAAVACLQRGLKACSEAPELLLPLAEALLDQDEPAEVGPLLARLVQVGGRWDAVAYLQARLLLQQGRWLEAAAALERLRTPQTESALLDRVEFYLGACYGQVGDTDRQLLTYRQALERTPQSAPLRMALGSALLDLGQPDQAVDECSQVRDLTNPPPLAWVILARAMVAQALAQPPAQRDWDEVDEVLTRASRAAPETAEVPILRAEVLMAQGKFEEAASVLAAAQRQLPDEAAIWAAQVRLALQRQQQEVARQTLDKARERLGDRVELRLATAFYLLKVAPADAAVQLGRLEQGLEHFSRADQDRLLRGLAETCSRAGDRATTRRLWTRVAAQHPNDVQVRLLLFDLEYTDRDDRALERLMEELRRIEGEEGVLWRYAEAALALTLARQGDPSLVAVARQRLHEASVRRPGWSRVPLLEAHFDELVGNRRAALKNYLRAIELGDRQPGVARRVSELLAEQGRDNAVNVPLARRED